jgi:hypothetical protein
MLVVRFAAISLGIALIFPSSIAMFGQAGQDTPAAPIPSQILTAKKVFISNARGEWNSIRWSGSPERTYNEFYANIKNLGRFQIVATPAEADLVLQAIFIEPITVLEDAQVSAPLFKLDLLDPKTGITLWTLDEHIWVDKKQENRDKKFDEGIHNLVGYLMALYPQPAAHAK